MKHQGQTTSETIWIVSLGSMSLGSMDLAASKGISARLSRARDGIYTPQHADASSMSAVGVGAAGQFNSPRHPGRGAALQPRRAPGPSGRIVRRTRYRVLCTAPCAGSRTTFGLRPRVCGMMERIGVTEGKRITPQVDDADAVAIAGRCCFCRRAERISAPCPSPSSAGRRRR